jgi:trimethylamine--corrinoid protein Co-methyltransferase
VREEWQAAGATDLYTRAAQKAREIIETHKPEPLPDDIAKRVHAVVEAADRERGVA